MRRDVFRIPQDWSRYLGIDFGNVNRAAIFFAEEPVSKRLYAYREYKPGVPKPVKEHVDALLKSEPMLPLAMGGSASENDWRGSFASLGLPIREPDIVGRDSVEVGIERVYAALKRQEIVIFSDLEHLLAEFGSYSRVLDEQGNATEEIDGKEQYHMLDATRYVIGWLKRLGCGPITPPDDTNRSLFADAPEGVFGDWHKELYGDSITFGDLTGSLGPLLRPAIRV